MRPAVRSQAMTEPCSMKKLTSFSTSVMFGTFSNVTLASVSSVAHRMGSTEFLLPEGVIVPLRGLPPWMMRSAILDVGKMRGGNREARIDDSRAKKRRLQKQTP